MARGGLMTTPQPNTAYEHHRGWGSLILVKARLLYLTVTEQGFYLNGWHVILQWPLYTTGWLPSEKVVMYETNTSFSCIRLLFRTASRIHIHREGKKTLEIVALNAVLDYSTSCTSGSVQVIQCIYKGGHIHQSSSTLSFWDLLSMLHISPASFCCIGYRQ